MTPDAPHPVTVVKLGGSLVTDKTRRDAVHVDTLQHLASVLARSAVAARRELLLILGGGSVGHFAAVEFGVDRGGADCNWRGLQEMASKMYAWKGLLADALRALDIPALAFQETSYAFVDGAGAVAIYDRPIRHALGHKIVPILSGGLVFDAARGVRPVNGDLLVLGLDPAFFALERVVMLTDVAGVMAADGAILGDLDDESLGRMANTAANGRVDVTGGMRTKVEVALQLARRGVRCVIADGHALTDSRFEELAHGMPAACSRVGFTSIQVPRRP